jgi:hypothetical protein
MKMTHLIIGSDPLIVKINLINYRIRSADYENESP